MDILVITTRWDICLFSRSECDSVCLLLLVLPRRPNQWEQWPELLVAVRGMNDGLNVYNLKHIIAGFRRHWKWISQMAIKNQYGWKEENISESWDIYGHRCLIFFQYIFMAILWRSLLQISFVEIQFFPWSWWRLHWYKHLSRKQINRGGKK